jgi:hydrogenase nickel incorporation protein HypA/HybF
VRNGRGHLFPRAVRFRFLPRMSLWSHRGLLKMHELSVAQGLVEVACEALAGCEPAPARVGSLRVRIGALAGVVPDALEFCYGLSVEGTPLFGSRLVIERQPVVVFCPRCLENRTLEDDFRFRCPVCDTPTPELMHGRELELISMELIDYDDPTRQFESNLDREPAAPDFGGAPGAAEG